MSNTNERVRSAATKGLPAMLGTPRVSVSLILFQRFSALRALASISRYNCRHIWAFSIFPKTLFLNRFIFPIFPLWKFEDFFAHLWTFYLRYFSKDFRHFVTLRKIKQTCSGASCIVHLMYNSKRYYACVLTTSTSLL